MAAATTPLRSWLGTGRGAQARHSGAPERNFRDARVSERSRQSGVTLMEMLIVVAIAGAMVSIALPAFSNGLDNIRLSQATDATATFLNGALNRVERRQEVMEMTISPRDNLILMRSADGSFTRKIDLPDGVRVEGALPRALGDNAEPRRFLLLPGATPPRFGVQLANRRGQRRIISIDPITGAPKIERPTNP